MKTTFLLLLVFLPVLPASAAPQANTLPASGISNNMARLNGTVTPGGLTTTGWFEWGLGMMYNHQTAPVSFKDPMTTMAAIDRLVHHATILEFDGESVRAKKAKARSAP